MLNSKSQAGTKAQQKAQSRTAVRQAAITPSPMLGDVLLLLGKRSIYIPDFIKENAKTRAIPILKKQFEELIKKDKRFTSCRTSQIFHKAELKRLPMVRGYYMSHINIA